ncbi:MAG: hypothetical protein ACREPP_06495 [Rhodanobacteraceae bacterium]
MIGSKLGNACARALKAALPVLALAFVAGFSQGPLAATTISPIETPLTGTADRMISYREQNHSWQTSDGAFHLLINTGNQPSRDALRLYTTRDLGATWTAGPTLPSTNGMSTEDGVLIGNSLAIAYVTTANNIKFASFVWNSASGTWSGNSAQTVFASNAQTALNPCLGRDSVGNVWVAFATTDAEGDSSIRMMVRQAGTNEWVDPGLTFGDTATATVEGSERSARPVQIPGGMGMVYSVQKDLYWASRSDSAALGDPWATQLLYTHTGGGNDPYASHFSVANDAEGNLHLATVDGGELLYLHYDAGSATWSQRVLAGSGIQANYPQVTIVGSTLVVAANVKTNAGVFTSPDLGQTFTYSYALQHGAYGPGITFKTPRIETAASSTSPVLLFQQYYDHGSQRLLEYAIPIENRDASSH